MRQPCLMTATAPHVPDELPFLEAVSWYDRRPRELSAREMLSRYEAGWRFRGVLCEPTGQERAWIRYLAQRFGSIIDP
ncbi:MAG: hypothetical protein JW940_03300 [Polyangiaceae bacterium]|nr:hypothetical protein [Polyangiaceae bacterium]